MRFTLLAAAFATVASVFAQDIQFMSTPDQAKVGTTYTITWSPNPNVSKVNLYLRSGKSGNLDQGVQIASNLNNANSFQWTPSPSLANTDSGNDDTMYTFEIRYTDNGVEKNNYSARISLSGGSSSKNDGTTSTITSTIEMTTTMTMNATTTSTSTDAEKTSTNATTTTTGTSRTASRTSEPSSNPSSPSGGSTVASSSTLAMVFCVLAAVFYIN